MSQKINHVSVNTIEYLILACLVQLCAITGCADTNCHKDADGKNCIETPIATCTPVCRGKETCNTSSLQCECKHGYIGTAGRCKPICDVKPHDPFCPPDSPPDLVPSGLFVGQYADTHSNLLLCFMNEDHKLAITNKGGTRAGSNHAFFGVLDIDNDQVAGGCLAAFSDGIAAGETAEFSDTGKCCKIPLQRLPSDHSFVFFLLADYENLVAESNEDNNFSWGSVLTRSPPKP